MNQFNSIPIFRGSESGKGEVILTFYKIVIFLELRTFLLCKYLFDAGHYLNFYIGKMVLEH